MELDIKIQKIIEIIRSKHSLKWKKDQLSNYHENDIADAIPHLSEEGKNTLYRILDKDDFSEVVSYIDDADELIGNLDEEKAADILEEMDSDDAVDILENLDEEKGKSILSKMDKESREDAELILSYDEDEIGRLMTTNFIVINKDDDVTKAMKELIKQSGDNDNISTIFVVDENEKYTGALDLKDLIRARKNSSLQDLFVLNYPSVSANDKISEVYQDIIDYGEDIIPVVDQDNKLIGAITAHDLVEVVGDEMSDDYEKFAALNGNIDLDSTVWTSIKKRAPWLIILLFLGFLVSLFIQTFSVVIASLTTLVFFQSTVLDMAGNSGTQSLAVTVRVLSDPDVDRKMILKLIGKESAVGLINGLLLGVIGFLSSLLYFVIFKVGISSEVSYSLSLSLELAGIIGLSLFASMALSSLIGTLIPVFFFSIKIDPAVASGPLITTVNDLVAVFVYYGLSYLLFMSFII